MLFWLLCLSSSFLFSLVYSQTGPAYGKHRLITYIVDWDIPNTIPWNKLDHVAYAFAVPDKSGELTLFKKDQLLKIAKEAHSHGKGVSLGIGGWTGSVYFSSLLKTPTSRKSFATKLLNAVEKYGLNGLNIDWEYPNDPNGISCNQKHPQDTENLLDFIRLLRQMLDTKYPNEHKLITAAVSAYVFKGSDQKPITELDKGWATYMDAFYIMAYDLNGVWSNTAASNAPLRFGATGQQVSGESAVQAWINAGIPSDRIYLGVPFYGYTHKTLKPITRETGMDVPFDRTIPQIKGDNHDSYAADPCPGAKPSFSGEYQWRSIETSGVSRNASGWSTYWDQMTETPFAYNKQTNQFVTYDDPASLRIKTQFAKEHGLGGMMLWSLEMDDTSHSLLNALQGVRA